MKSFGVLKKRVLAWAEERKLNSPQNKMAQGLKTLEEVQEMLKAIDQKKKVDIMDGIGDVVVTLIIQAKKNGWELEECLEHAYDQIKDRTGKTVKGEFVKDTATSPAAPVKKRGRPTKKAAAKAK